VTLVVQRLRSQVPDGVLCIGADVPRLSWQVSASHGGLVQLGYELEAADSPTFESLLASTGPRDGDVQLAVPAPGGSLRSREVRYYRVRVRGASGWSGWSETLRVEAGLIEPGAWTARGITLPNDPGRSRQAPAPVLRRAFDIPKAVASARLHVTALGAHRVSLNGRLVTDDVLAPGWTSYRYRVIADTYDVTRLLIQGQNVIGAVLGDGWYRGRLGWDPANDRGRYGTELGLVAQLEIDCVDGTRLVVATDGSWRASTAEVRAADLYDGSTIDLRTAQPGWDAPGFDDSGWIAASTVPFDARLVEQRSAPPVRRIANLPVRLTRAGDSCWRLDGGQNISGWVRLTVRGARDDRVVVRHAEVLEPDGALHTRALRSAKATDTYVLAGDSAVVLEPAFTFHGFRYAEVESTAEIVAAEFVAISSDTPPRGTFECSDPDLTRFHENVVWSQRDNFVSIPTDCPQRDERLGWTGDAQAFAATGSTLLDAAAFWSSWLRDLAVDQDDELGVPSVVPDVVLAGELRFGRAGWADAATIVPWAVFESYGDVAVLEQQFPSMRAWVESLARRRGPDGLLVAGTQFGDWLDPDAPAGRPWEAKADSDYLANAYFVHSARLTADAAALLGDRSGEERYRALGRAMAAATWSRWSDHALESPTGCAVALQLGVAPDSERARVAAALAALVRAAGGRVATGFLGTPLVLPALVEFDYVDECYLMLLRREWPSWLYQVRQGGTTVWERWDAIRPDGSIHPGTMTTPQDLPDSGDTHMLSFNHYAYGAVIDWVYRHLAGIAPDRARPGYRHVLFAPKPSAGIDWANAAIETGYGRVAIGWRLDGESLSAEVELPFGTTGQFTAPITPASAVTLDGRRVARVADLEPGHHAIVVTAAAIAHPDSDVPAHEPTRSGRSSA
jgi:alpha-L-rhamnosidase